MNRTSQNCYYANIRSIAKNLDQLPLLLNECNNNRADFDVIALSETWITEEQLKLYSLNGYNSFIQPRMDGRRSGGVVMYVKDYLKVEKIDSLQIKTGNILKIILKSKEILTGNNTHEDDIVLILVYRDCTSSKKNVREGTG